MFYIITDQKSSRSFWKISVTESFLINTEGFRTATPLKRTPSRVFFWEFLYIFVTDFPIYIWNACLFSSNVMEILVTLFGGKTNRS